MDISVFTFSIMLFAQSSVSAWFCCTVLNRKRNFAVTFLALTVVPGIIALAAQLPGAYPASLVLSGAALIIGLLIFFQNPLLTKIFALIFLTAVHFAGKLLSATFLSLLGTSPQQASAGAFSTDRVLDMLIFNTLYFVVIFLCAPVLKHVISHCASRSYTLFALFPVSQGILLLGLCYTYIEIRLESILVFAGAGILLAIAADALLFHIFVENAEKKLLETRLAFAEQQSHLQTAYYDGIRSHAEQVRRMRHDFNNQLQTVLLFAESAPENLLSSLRLQTESMHFPHYCAYPLLNAVFESKRKKAEALGLQMEISVQIPAELPLQKSEVCSLFDNLLNNAIEGCAHAPNGKQRIVVRAAQEEPYLFIRVENGFDGVVNTRTDGTLHSRKANPEAHGLGLIIVERIARKYGGTVAFGHTEDSFTTAVSLQLYSLERSAAKT